MPLFETIKFEVNSGSSPNSCYKPTKFESGSGTNPSSCYKPAKFESKKDDGTSSNATLLLAGICSAALIPQMPFLIAPAALCIGWPVYDFLNRAIKMKDDKIMRNLGIMSKNEEYPVLLDENRSANGNINYVYRLPAGLSIKDIQSKQEQIENVLKSNVNIYLAENYNVIISTQNAKYEERYALNLSEIKPHSMVFEIGRDINNNAITLDLGGNELHTGVFGANGTGKSVFLNVLMTQFVLKNIETRVIDLKGGVEFSMYRNYDKMSYFAITEDQAQNILEKTVKLMDQRYKKLLDKGCKSYKDCKDMPPVVLLIDEYNVLIDNKECKKLLFALLSRARAANIICIICTQRPSREVLPGNLKCNIKNFVTFRVENETDSEIVLSQKGNYMAFKSLRKAGEGLLKCCGKITPFKSYYLSDNEIRAAIHGRLNKKTTIAEAEKKIKKEVVKKDIKKVVDLID